MKSCINPHCTQDNPQTIDSFYSGRNSCKSCHKKTVKKEYQAHWRSVNIDQVKGHWLRKYWPNLTWNESLNEFNNLLKSQNNLCAICKNPETSLDGKTQQIRDLSVDHCHITGRVRGLLCSTCNRGLGYFKDNSSLCFAAGNYLTSDEQT